MRAAALLCCAGLLLAGCPDSDSGEGADAGRDASVRKDAAVRDAAEDLPGPDAGQGPGRDAGIASDGGTATTLTQFWANTQWPPYLTLAAGEKATVYGQIWIQGGTEAAGMMPGLQGELGHGAAGSDPAIWTWEAASFNLDSGNNDELKAELTAPASGPVEYAFRYRVSGAVFEGQGEWLYAGLKGPTLAAGEAGLLAVRGAGAQVKVATQNLHCQHDDPAARFAALVARWAELQVDVVALEEVCEDASTGIGNSADYLAKALTAATGRTYSYVWVQTHLANDVTPEGVGLVSALPLASTATLDLVTADFARKVLLGAYASPAGMLAVVASHLSYRSEDADARLQQANQILALVDDWQKGSGRPTGTCALVAGDFNTTPDTAPIQAIVAAGYTDVWAAANPGQAGLSYPSYAPSERIDYLLLRPASGAAWAPLSASLEFAAPYSGTSYVSDHLGVVATLQAQ